MSYAAPVGNGVNEIIIDVNGRRVGIYPSPDVDDQFAKLKEAVRAVTRDEPVTCGPEAAVAQTLCANGVHESVPEILTVSTAIRRRGVDPDRYWIEGLETGLWRCYERYVLPSELGLSWAVSGRTVDLTNYDHFPATENSA